MDCKKGFVSGRVQGVGFRYFVQQSAQSLALTGYAKNLCDGRVEVLLVGPASRVLEAQHKVQQGPELSRVSSVEWEDANSGEQTREFLIL